MGTEIKNCQNCKQDFTIDSEDFGFYEKMQVPPPTFCPQCRMIRRLIWRNESNLYRAPDVRTGKEIFSEFQRTTRAKIYDVEYWKSDAWDAMEYGQDYDFSRPFFEQFKEFLYSVPWPSRSVMNLVNSDYCAEAGNLKNCYLCFNSDMCENCSYCIRLGYTKDSVDCLDGGNGELCYDATLFKEGFKLFFSYNCFESRNIWCSRDLFGCSDCVGCVGLRKKSYYIFNQPYSKEEYFVEVAKLKLNTYSGLRAIMKKMQELAKTRPVRFMNGTHNQNSTGDNLVHTKNAKECWGGNEMQDCKYCQMTYRGVTDSYDYCTWGDKASRIYECQTCGYEADNLKFCFDCWPSCERLEYAFFCRSSSDCFACVGLKKKQYCIFNKQYSKEEYEALVAKIKKQMVEMPYKDSRGNSYGYGEFFPIDLCPYGYNESQMQSLLPLTEAQAKEKGLPWAAIEAKEFATTVSANALPDDISDTKDGILKEIIACIQCKKAYRIIPNELQFLRQQSIPLPRECLTCRRARRAALLKPPVFYDGSCANCKVPFRTTYAPGRPEIVYCDICYQKEVE